jgi:vitamin B12 transporter
LRRPQHSINANLDWTPRDWLHLGASVQTVSDSRDSDYLTFSPTSLDGYTLVGLRASVSLGRQFELYGRVENLTDTRYETVSGYGTAGRNAHVGVRVKL